MDESCGSRARGNLALQAPARGGPQRHHADGHQRDEDDSEGGRDDGGAGHPSEVRPGAECGQEQQFEVQQPPGGRGQDGQEGAGEQPAPCDGEGRARVPGGRGVSPAQQGRQQTKLRDEAAGTTPGQ